MKLVMALFAVLSSLAVVTMNFNVFPRDIVMTKNVSSYLSKTVVGEKLWNETPLQLLYTFMPAGVLVNPGQPGAGGFLFANRLVYQYGAERIGFRNPIADVRVALGSEKLGEFRLFARDTGYESLAPCPHDYEIECEVLFTWNRERTKEKGIKMIFLRLGDLEYAVVDDSLISVDQ
jgi:hypothetical protein